MISKLTIGLYLAVLFASPLSAEEMGRLFFTPDQREQLDNNYHNGNSPQKNADSLILNGIVQKNGGKRTAWINGVSEMIGRSNERSPASASVEIPGKSTTVKIKVGQTVSIKPSSSD